MLLYHVSINKFHDGNFVPRVPRIRLEGECADVPRICFSKSIAGCFSALPNSGDMEELSMEMYGCFKLFVLDTEKAGLTDADIVLPEILYEKGMVDDAEVTEEVWVLKPVTATAAHHVLLERWEEVPFDIIPHYVMQVVDSEYDGDVEQAYTDLVPDNDGFLPSTVRIEDVVLRYDFLKKGDALFDIPFGDTGFLSELMDAVPGLIVSYDEETGCFAIEKGQLSLERFWEVVVAYT